MLRSILNSAGLVSCTPNPLQIMHEAFQQTILCGGLEWCTSGWPQSRVKVPFGRLQKLRPAADRHAELKLGSTAGQVYGPAICRHLSALFAHGR